MPRRRLLLTVPTLLAVALVVAGCTIPTTKDGGGYGPPTRTPARPRHPLRSSCATAPPRSSRAPTRPDAQRVRDRHRAKVALDISNADPTQHNFTFGELEISKNLPPDTSTEIRFTAPQPGRCYRFYCKYHQQEMQAG